MGAGIAIGGILSAVFSKPFDDDLVLRLVDNLF
jgi:hypothetical protein